MRDAQRLAVLCAISLALAPCALACGRYGPPVRAVSSGSTGQDPGAFETTMEPRRESREAVPYMLEGLVSEPGSTSDSTPDSTVESTSESAVERTDAEKEAQPRE